MSRPVEEEHPQTGLAAAALSSARQPVRRPRRPCDEFPEPVVGQAGKDVIWCQRHPCWWNGMLRMAQTTQPTPSSIWAPATAIDIAAAHAISGAASA